MKIRIESSSSHGYGPTGVGYYAQRLTEALRAIEAIEVVECQFDFFGRQLSSLDQKENSVETVNFPQKVYAKLDYFGVAFPFDLFKKPVDVTIFPNYALWPTIKSRLRVVTIHDLSFIKYPEVVEEKNLSYLNRVAPRSLQKADLVLTVSETVKNELMNLFGIAANKVHVTPIPPTEVYFQKFNYDVRKIYGIPTTQYILSLGTIEPRKNLDALLDAYDQMPASYKKNVSLVLAGGMGWKSESIQAKIIGLQEKYPTIITTGYLDQKHAPSLFRNATIFVMSAYYEGFGMPVLEAMASDTPTITSDIPVLREISNGASLHFRPDDSEQLSRHIIDLLDNKAKRAELVKKGQENLKRYSWEGIASSLSKKLSELLANS